MKTHYARLALLLTVLALPACQDRSMPTEATRNNPQVNTATTGVQATAATVPVTGTIASGGTFTGTLTITRFVTQNAQLFAVGTLTGTLTDALGNVIGTVTNFPVRLPVTAINGTCEILHLELGPLDLNLLGLMVHLDKVVLDITAQSGPGNLLGNLLCAIANLLNSSGSLASLVQLLNQLLGLLR